MFDNRKYAISNNGEYIVPYPVVMNFFKTNKRRKKLFFSEPNINTGVPFQKNLRYLN